MRNKWFINLGICTLLAGCIGETTDPIDTEENEETIGNIQRGKTIMESGQCSGCHQDTGNAAFGQFGGISPFNVNFWLYPTSSAFLGKNYSANSEKQLADFLEKEMPRGADANAAEACDKQCSLDVAAYLWDLRNKAPNPDAVACEVRPPVLYGQPYVKVLTTYEYKNSIKSFFAVEVPEELFQQKTIDEGFGRLPNNKQLKISDGRLQSYDQNALAIAQWAVSNPNALPFSCSDFTSQNCVNTFINEFAYKAYRRPLTQAEKSDLSEMLTNSISPLKGLEWAIRYVLASPQFLYRTELGVSVSEVQENGFQLPSTSSASGIGAGARIEAESFSRMSGVETEETLDIGGGENVGYIDEGDFLEYDIAIDYPGNYQISFRVASQDGGGSFSIEGDANSNIINAPNTGDWQNWETITQEINLQQGNQTLRLTANTAGFNINWLELSFLGSDEGGNKLRIEAEDFDTMSGVEIEATSDTGGGENIGYIDENDFLEYAIDVASAGEYLISYRIASQDGGGRIALSDGVNSQLIDVPATGDWQNWQTISHTFNLDNGTNILRLAAAASGFNINWLELLPLTNNEESASEWSQLQAAEPDAYVLDPFEYASALAFMYTGIGPDEELLQLASQGKLKDMSIVEQQIERLLQSPLGHAQVQRFAAAWLKTDFVQNTALVRDNPNFTAAVKESMAYEVRTLFDHVFYDESVPFSELYSANYTFLDSTLADFYGKQDGGLSHLDFKKVITPERGGIITSGAFMSFYAHKDETSPILRSVYLRQNMLCQDVPPPPQLGELGSDQQINIEIVNEKMATGELTSTEKYHLLTDAGVCRDCHGGIINPLFGMDDFDHTGLPRKRINGIPVQKGLGENGKEDIPIEWFNRGVLYGVNSIEEVAGEQNANGGIQFQGAKDLSAKLAEEPATAQCFIRRSFRFATGSPMNAQDHDGAEISLTEKQKQDLACVTKELNASFDDSQSSPYALFKAIGMSDVLRFRKP